MRLIAASAPGKIILLGEHAVVYGRPALAAPVSTLRATAEARAGQSGIGVTLELRDLEQAFRIAEATEDYPLATLIRLTLATANVPEPDVTIAARSNIPVASGLGSGAAVSAAIARALFKWLGKPVSASDLSAIVFEVEKLYHGTPSGIDNTVICHEKPLLYTKGQPYQLLTCRQGIDLIIADTGQSSPTKASVAAVRELWQQDTTRFEAIFTEVAALVTSARECLEKGDMEGLGERMTLNQELLRLLTVSSDELETLIGAAHKAGALGAKLSGGGRGGVMIALPPPRRINSVSEALKAAGAVRVFHTRIQ